MLRCKFRVALSAGGVGITGAGAGSGGRLREGSVSDGRVSEGVFCPYLHCLLGSKSNGQAARERAHHVSPGGRVGPQQERAADERLVARQEDRLALALPPGTGRRGSHSRGSGGGGVTAWKQSGLTAGVGSLRAQGACSCKGVRCESGPTT